jgi:hypothetical protein
LKALWPRLPLQVARQILDDIEAGKTPLPETSHPAQVFAQVGGRVAPEQIRILRHDLVAVATRFSYPEASPRVVEFDRAATPVLRRHIDVTWSEAASREVWNFIALVAVPDLTEWRWLAQAKRNAERWIASDLQRHTWGRLWWQGAAFAMDPGLLDRLSESDLNQLLERRVIGGNPHLLVAMSRSLLSMAGGTGLDREVLRDATKRLRRLLAFIDDSALSEPQLAALADRVVGEAVAFNRRVRVTK